MPVLLQRIWIQLTADRKRFAVLTAALGVALLLWARLIIVSNVPRTAVADEHTTAAQDSSSDGTLGGVEAGSKSSRTPVAVMLDREPKRDPFMISTRFFPKPVPEGSSSITAKSESLAAEEAEQARNLAVLHGLVHLFRLEAVMIGDRDSDTHGSARGSIAVINGQTWRPGQFIPAVGNQDIEFELVEIRSRSVLLQIEEHTFELAMPSVR